VKKIAAMVVLVGVAVGVGLLAYKVWGMPHDSNVAIFRIVMIGFIPIPIPVGFLTSPHFWGGLLFLLSGVIAFTGVRQLRN
jgi:hypothetical protein